MLISDSRSYRAVVLVDIPNDTFTGFKCARSHSTPIARTAFSLRSPTTDGMQNALLSLSRHSEDVVAHFCYSSSRLSSDRKDPKVTKNWPHQSENPKQMHFLLCFFFCTIAATLTACLQGNRCPCERVCVSNTILYTLGLFRKHAMLIQIGVW